MKKIGLILIMILTIGVINVKAAEAINVPTCGVSISGGNADQDYTIIIERITTDAPMPTNSSISLMKGEEKNFGSISYDEPNVYEYKISIDGEEDYFIYTVVVVDEEGLLRSDVFVKKNGVGNKLSSVVFDIKEDEPDPTPNPKPTPSGGNRPIINPNTVDLIVRFLVVLAASAAAVVVLIKLIRKNKEENK